MFISNLWAAGERDVRLNQIQVIGTHNSYHRAPDGAVMAFLKSVQPKQARALAYTHRPLAEQFAALGIRQIELDVFADPAGGLYADPRGQKLGKPQGKEKDGDRATSAVPHDSLGLLKKPGMKVLHVPDYDYRTTVPTLVDGLRQVRAWSRANPRHVPLFVLLELKDDPHPTLPPPVHFDSRLLDALEAEILSVFARDELLTPDNVRGESATLPEALQTRGWPLLDAVRGRVMFALDNEDKIRDVYLEGHPALGGRLLFVSVAETHPAAAWMKVNEPVRDFDRIVHLVKRGFLVRTRADADTVEARANDPSHRDKALASGAQFVSTDYPEPDRSLSPYCVRLPGDVVARSNPVSGDPKLAGVELEALGRGRAP
jgi:hypothetical protein